ncbi:MAG: SRPBCC domain-containing protein [Solirubrobacterales bacterium]|nr:SRPBCC domain-containing protein [Solirubrobacterales bacterium]
MPERVERELVLRASPEELWQAITGPGWLAAEVQLELRPGGEARFVDADGIRSGWIEDALAPSRLIFWWADAETEEPASRVEVILEPLPDARTRVKVVETRPLDVLDLVGIPLPGSSGARFGPALLAA